MNYIELAVTLQPYSEDMADIGIAALADAGFESFSETEEGFNAYIPEKDYNAVQAIEALNQITEGDFSLVENHIAAQNWNEVWESNFDPIVIDTRCTIRAPFHHNLPRTDIEIVMEPKMAFGTGHHETTYLCTLALLESNVQGLQVLDMGCGTGILAMVAAKRGARHIDAIDIEEPAYHSTIENSQLNGVAEAITPMLGDANLVPQAKYDLVIANINRNILLQDMPVYARALLPGGRLIVSGIYTQDVEMVAQAAAAVGLQLYAQRERNNWAMAEFGTKI